MERPKTVLVTGAGSGIGAAIAERFLSAGYQVALFDIDGQAARATASRINFAARREVFEGDVSNEQNVKEAVARTVADLGSLDVLINNAGIEIHAANRDRDHFRAAGFEGAGSFLEGFVFACAYDQARAEGAAGDIQ